MLTATTFLAYDPTVFTLNAGSPATISVQVTAANYLKAGIYNMVYRASLTNLRTSSVVNLDAPFTVTVVDRCATTTFSAPSPALTAMSTTALAGTTTTQTLTIKDTVSTANTPSDGWTYCGFRTFTINSGLSPKTFLTLTTGSYSSVLSLLSTTLTDYSASPYAIVIKVCLVNYSSLCTTTSTAFTLTVGACVATYTAAAYTNVVYVIGTASITTPYPTYT